MSESYRLMTYFAVATIMFYEKTIVVNENTTVESFMIDNKEVCQRVFDEGLTTFKYELSGAQIRTAVTAYISSKLYPQSVFETTTTLTG